MGPSTIADTRTGGRNVKTSNLFPAASRPLNRGLRESRTFGLEGCRPASPRFRGGLDGRDGGESVSGVGWGELGRDRASGLGFASPGIDNSLLLR